MNPPIVTVFMPLYNAGKYVSEAIESILNQDFTSFELLIINDGSSDNSVSIVEKYNDSRIRLIHNDENKGLVFTANRGLELSHGTYIARMDADDISMPRRLGSQVQFLDGNPHIGICGSSIRYFGSRSGKMRCVCDPDAIKATLFWSTTFAQPTVMMRKAMLDCHSLRYDPAYMYGAEDYALWNQASQCFAMANLPKVLLNYRVNPQSVSHKWAGIQITNTLEIIKGNFLRLGHSFDNNLDALVRNNLMAGQPLRDMDQLVQFERILIDLRQLNEARQVYPVACFNKTLSDRLFRVCVKSAHLGRPMLNLYRNSSVGGFAPLNMEQRLRLISKVIDHAIKHVLR